ncbi:MAG: hypothetical protein KA419_07180 [Acidobacteria bacterium]|nr:hypothetical protein [Acidobacteriota bacterium]
MIWTAESNIKPPTFTDEPGSARLRALELKQGPEGLAVTDPKTGEVIGRETFRAHHSLAEGRTADRDALAAAGYLTT